MSGSSKYNVTINGIKQKVTGNSFEATLSTGLSIIRVDTDLECQGFVEEKYLYQRIFIIIQPD